MRRMPKHGRTPEYPDLRSQQISVGLIELRWAHVDRRGRRGAHWHIGRDIELVTSFFEPREQSAGDGNVELARERLPTIEDLAAKHGWHGKSRACRNTRISAKDSKPIERRPDLGV